MEKTILFKCIFIAAFIMSVFSSCSFADTQKPFETVEAYLENEEVKEYMNDILEPFSQGEMTLSFDGNEDTFIYAFTVPSDEGKEKFAELIAPGVEAQSETYTKAAKRMKDVINQDVIKVIVRYIDADGEILYEREFSSE